MLKQNNGVTLVALVITIIVLLILAGVSISLVVGDNGVLNQAVNAADATNEAAATSEIQMAVTAAVTDFMADKYTTDAGPSSVDITDYITTGTLQSNMAEGFEVEVVNFTDGASTTTATVTYRGVEYHYDLQLTTSKNSCKVTFDEEATYPTTP